MGVAVAASIPWLAQRTTWDKRASMHLAGRPSLGRKSASAPRPGRRFRRGLHPRASTSRSLAQRDLPHQGLDELGSATFDMEFRCSRSVRMPS